MPQRKPHKRSASSSGEQSTAAGTSHAPKKTRFVEPAEDPARFAEEVDSALEDPSTKRKGRVKNEGYNSDSSDDGEGVVLSRKKGKEAEEDEDDDDMFAAAEKEPKEDEPSAKKKKDAYLRLGDIEGQEFGDGSDSAESEDEDDHERKQKAGMGYELSSFNMRDEMEEGKFTEDGTYVRSFDPHGVHDRWMDGLNDKEIKQAKRRKRQQEQAQKEKMHAEEQELQQTGGKGAMEKQLLAMLKKGETVLEALQRLGRKEKPKAGPNVKGKKKADSMPVDKKSTKSSTDIERITHLATTIMSLGDTDVYNETYEELVRHVRSSGLVDASWEPPSADIKYEYRWDVPEAAGQNGQVFGPFGEEELKAWHKAAYFGEYGEKVQLRQVAGEWGAWDDVMS